MNFYGIAGAPMDDGKGFWGVAVDDIEPQKYGCVQVSGVAILSSKYLKGVYQYFETPYDSSRLKKNKYVYAGGDGFFHLGNHGQASVIYYSKTNGNALVLLGCKSPDKYDGMFAVHDNGDKTLRINAGSTDLDSFYTGYARFEDTVLPVISESSEWHYVCLIASWIESRWHLSADIHRYPNSYFYVPGEKIFVPLARYSGIRSDGYIRDLVQLHQGGMVNFRERYYIES
jgi:hypothetical protein